MRCRAALVTTFLLAALVCRRANAEESRPDLPPPVVRRLHAAAEPAAAGASVVAAPREARAILTTPPPLTPSVPTPLRASPAPAPPAPPAAALWTPTLSEGGSQPARALALRPARRGPIEVRDEWLLSQPRLTLPAVSPDPLGCGVWQLRMAINRGNDFGWTQTRAGELPTGGDRRFLVDGEHQSVSVGLRYGLSSTVDVGLRLPVLWRGAGIMDGLIDFFHETTGFMDNIRSAFLTDRFRVEGRSEDFVPFSWNDAQGTGLGNLELAGHWAFAGARPGAPWSVALVGRGTLPTATDPFDVGGVDLGAQVVAAHPLSRTLDVYLGLGGTWFSEREIDGITYEPLRASGFVVLEWRPASTWSLLVEVNAASNLVTSVARYPTLQAYLNIGAKIDLSSRWQLEVGFVENLEDQQATTDFGIFAGLVGRL